MHADGGRFPDRLGELEVARIRLFSDFELLADRRRDVPEVFLALPVALQADLSRGVEQVRVERAEVLLPEDGPAMSRAGSLRQPEPEPAEPPEGASGHCLQFLVAGERLPDPERGERVPMQLVFPERGDVQLQGHAAALRKGAPGSVLEHLVSHAAMEGHDDHASII